MPPQHTDTHTPPHTHSFTTHTPHTKTLTDIYTIPIYIDTQKHKRYIHHHIHRQTYTHIHTSHNTQTHPHTPTYPYSPHKHTPYRYTPPRTHLHTHTHTHTSSLSEATVRRPSSFLLHRFGPTRDIIWGGSSLLSSFSYWKFPPRLCAVG